MQRLVPALLRASWPVWTRRAVAVACIRRVLLVTMHLALCSFLDWQASSAQHSGRYGPERQLSEEYRLLVFLGDDFCGLLHSALSWFVSGYMRCVILRGSWKVFGVVQTVRKTVEVPNLFLDMAVDRCLRWSRQCRKLWSLRSSCCPPLSLFTAVSAGALVSQRPWITSISGDGDLAASSFTVSCFLGSVAQGFEP